MLLVIMEIIPFVEVYFGVLVFFAILFTQCSKHGESFTSGDDYPTLVAPLRALLATWNLGLGSMEYAFKTPIGAFMYFNATIILVIVMLNLLISVVSDYYEMFQMQKVKIEMRLKA